MGAIGCFPAQLFEISASLEYPEMNVFGVLVSGSKTCREILPMLPPYTWTLIETRSSYMLETR